MVGKESFKKPAIDNLRKRYPNHRSHEILTDCDPYSWLEKSLETIHRANWYRSVKAIAGRGGATVNLEGREVINFASNDYLGLAGDDRLVEAAVKATREYGTGSTGSRLLSGHRRLHRELEEAIAGLKQTEDALVFSSGYLANLGTIAALVGQRDLILGDRYNHSSLKKGAILSGAKAIEYDHCDRQDLEEKLQEYRQNYRRCLIATDSVFSMDGDLCPLPELLELAERYDAMLLVDEAHATGILGKTGAGCVEHFQCTHQPLIQIGTLSKALGSLGGYVAGSKVLIDFLHNRAPTWIYTTGLSPGDTAAAIAAIHIICQEPERREKLWKNVNLIKQNLTQKFTLFPSQSPILCIALESPEIALNLSKHLQERGIFAPAIRPPTVPTSRIRLSVMATHEPEHIEKIVQILNEL
ncbi:MAG: 8-amino-7-oxononanoate synthase [Cyanobacteria bacterium P01_E01_bin.42]